MQFVEEFNWIIATILAVLSGLFLMFVWQFFHRTPIKMLRTLTKDNEKLKEKNQFLYGTLVKIQGNSVALVYDKKYPDCVISITSEIICSLGLLNYGEKTIDGVEVIFTGSMDTFNDSRETTMHSARLTKENITLKQNTTVPMEFVEFVRFKPNRNELLIADQSLVVDIDNAYTFILLVLGKDINESKWTATVSFNNNAPEISVSMVEKVLL